MSQVEQVTQKCPQCQRVADGFLIPDGRFVCPNCFHPAVYERWKREWEPLEKKRLKEQAAKEKAELKQQLYRESLKDKIAEQKTRDAERSAKQTAKQMVEKYVKQQGEKEQAANKKKDVIVRHAPCQVCGSLDPLIVKSRGDLWRALALLAFLTPIGIVYCLLYDGRAYHCSKCEVEVAPVPNSRFGCLTLCAIVPIAICVIIWLTAWAIHEHDKTLQWREEHTQYHYYR